MSQPTSDGLTDLEQSAPQPSQGRTAPRRRNPYLVAIFAIWLTCLIAGMLFLARASSVNEYAPEAIRNLGYAALIVAAAVGLVHLAVKAVRWRDDP